MTIGNAWAECWNEASWAVGVWFNGAPPPVTQPSGGGGSRGTIYEDRRYFERQAKREAARAAKLTKPKKRVEIEKAIEAVPENTGWTDAAKEKLVNLLMRDAEQFEQVMIKYYELLLKEAAEIERINNQKMARLKQDDEAMAAILLSAW